MIHIYFDNYYENLKNSVHNFDNKVTFFLLLSKHLFCFSLLEENCDGFQPDRYNFWRTLVQKKKENIYMYFVIFWKLNLCILIRMHNKAKVFLTFKIFSKPSRLKSFSVLFVQMLCHDMLLSKFKQNIVKKYEHEYKNATPRCEKTFWFLSFFRDLSNVRRPLRKNGFLNVAARAAQTPQVRPCPFI